MSLDDVMLGSIAVQSRIYTSVSCCRQPKQMGFYILGSWGYIPPGLRGETDSPHPSIVLVTRIIYVSLFTVYHHLNALCLSYLYASAFHLDSACLWNRNYTIYPFGYRTHSHNLGECLLSAIISSQIHQTSIPRYCHKPQANNQSRLTGSSKFHNKVNDVGLCTLFH